MIGKTACIDVGVIGMLTVIAFSPRVLRYALGGIFGAAVLAVIIGSQQSAYWVDADRGLLVWAIAAAGVAGWRTIRRRGESSKSLARLCLLIFGLTSLVKIFFNVRTYHYGFVLAVPCMISLVLALVRWLPDAVDRMGGGGRVVRWGSVAILAALAWNRMATTQRVLAERTVTVPLTFGGTLMSRAVDEPVIEAMKVISQLPGGATLDVLPDGSGINYAIGRVNPTPFDLADPICLHLDGGEAKVLAALRENPPDAILLIHFDKSALGSRMFGETYALSIYAWLESNYGLSATFGDGGDEKPAKLWLRRREHE